MGASPERSELGKTIMAAAEQFCNDQQIGLTSKRLLFEYLAMVGENGQTLSGLCKQGMPGGNADVVGVTRKFMGHHIIKHYYIMRQYLEASGVVMGFLQHLRSETSLPADFAAELNRAIEVATDACEQLPHIWRILKLPDIINEAYAFCYPLRPWPLSHVPQSTAVKDTSSRAWPADPQQKHHAWVSFVSERSRVEPEEVERVLAQVPRDLEVTNRDENCWEVKAILPDDTILLREWRGSREYVVQFTAKRAAEYMPGIVMHATVVTLSNGTSFITDGGYISPAFYAPYLTSKDEFGPYDPVDVVY